MGNFWIARDSPTGRPRPSVHKRNGLSAKCSLSALAISHHLTQLLCPMFQCLDRKRQKKHTVDGLNPQPGVDTPN